MQESRMIAVVVPPGCCAMEKVSGSRIATPFAPPRPGSTPMITPSTMPTNMKATFLKLSATRKPCASDWISSINARPSAHAQEILDRSLGQRDEEPDLEDQEERDHYADAHDGDFPPGVFSEPAHEEGDEDHRGDIDADPADQRNVDHRRHKDGEHELQLIELDEIAPGILAVDERHHEIDQRRQADEDADIEGEIARLRTVLGPARAETHAVEDDDCAGKEEERRYDELGALL